MFARTNVLLIATALTKLVNLPITLIRHNLVCAHVITVGRATHAR